ncbi:probable E3 ubiquitin-protein ligase RHC2A [Vigna radiata var. radiata]|uniref:Probable E3 ubiquitin-protein ligase RHC2A n=1 Tax=Vigna radiata var. radiata TaxID=3916 RepID=A0A1S3U0L7_VIGRR|nr:probable E3 ubiquitin-protein ligase RHC2A [Vigna radiata var. radiata]
MAMQWSIVDDGFIIEFAILGHHNNNNRGNIRSGEEDVEVYVLDSVNLGGSNIQNNGSRSLRSSEDGILIFDSVQYNYDSLKNLERFIIEEKTEDSCCICLEEFAIGSSAIRIPHTCSHIFHHHCITEWLDINHTCPLCRRNI